MTAAAQALAELRNRAGAPELDDLESADATLAAPKLTVAASLFAASGVDR